MESEFKNARIRCGIRRMRVDGSFIRKEEISQKYPLDTCGLGLSIVASEGSTHKKNALTSLPNTSPST